MDNGASSYRRFLDGDKNAFYEIMKDYFDGLVFFINGYVRDTAAAEDIAIDAFADLVVYRRRYDFRTSFKTYLYMIGRSRALNFLKKRKRLNEVGIDEAASLPSGTHLPEAEFINGENRRTVNAAVNSLPVEMREAVRLVYFEGLSYEDAAGIMKKNKKQVDNLIYRAKGILRQALGEGKQ